MRRLYSAVILVAFGGAIVQADVIQPFVPATDIQIQIRTEVLLSAPDKFQYRYTIFSSTASHQKVRQFFVETGGVPVVAVTPPGWHFVGISNVLTANWGAKVVGDIMPGSSLGGFVLSASGPPRIARTFTRGLAPLVAVESEGDIPPRIPSTYEDAIIELTVGPSTFTFTDPSSAIDRLIALKHQSASLGWLRGEEFIKQLDKKLDQAKKALAEGKGFKARKKLKQFVKKLEHQRKKQQERQKEASEKGKEKRDEHAREDKRFIDDNAFFLLKVNAEFIISKLPAKPKDKEEEREDKDDDE